MMKTSLLNSFRFASLALAVVFAITSASQAAIISLTDTRVVPDRFGASSMDPVTGKFYTRSGTQGYGHPSGLANIREYTDATAYASNTGSAIGTLEDGLFGTYFAVNDGDIFGRGGTRNNTEIFRWDAATGAKETSVTIPDLGAGNVFYSFNWGGFTAFNVMQDQTGMYVVGKQATGNLRQVTQIDTDLNLVATKTFAQTQDANYGYGFMVNGNLFLGDSFHNDNISTQFNFASGTVSSVFHTLSGGPLRPYWSNTFYDPNADALYFHSRDDRIYRSAGISNTLGVASISTVPEPASCLTFSGLALCFGIAGWRRRRKQSGRTKYRSRNQGLKTGD